MLYRLALEGQRVVYHKRGDDPLLFCADGAFRQAQLPSEQLDRSDTWWGLAGYQQSAFAFSSSDLVGGFSLA